jgi:hypothetical protein
MTVNLKVLHSSEHSLDTVCNARGPRRLTCAEQPDLLKLGIILIRRQTVQKPRKCPFRVGSGDFVDRPHYAAKKNDPRNHTNQHETQQRIDQTSTSSLSSETASVGLGFSLLLKLNRGAGLRQIPDWLRALARSQPASDGVDHDHDGREHDDHGEAGVDVTLQGCLGLLGQRPEDVGD